MKIINSEQRKANDIKGSINFVFFLLLSIVYSRKLRLLVLLIFRCFQYFVASNSSLLLTLQSKLPSRLVIMYWHQLLLLSLCTFATGRLGTLPQPSSSEIKVANSYIIELNIGAQNVVGNDFAYKEILGQGNYNIRHEFPDVDLFYGFSVTLSDETDIGQLKKHSAVKSVWPIQKFSVPRVFPVRSNDTHGASTVNTKRNDIHTVPNYRNSTADVHTWLEMSSVLELHSRGIKGKGIQVALLDTGVDYRHPALGGGFGPGFKISKGYDFIGDDSEHPKEDPNPLATCGGDGGHGTHTMGKSTSV